MATTDTEGFLIEKMNEINGDWIPVWDEDNFDKISVMFVSDKIKGTALCPQKPQLFTFNSEDNLKRFERENKKLLIEYYKTHNLDSIWQRLK